MSKLIDQSDDGGLWFWCPGCETQHRIQHGEGSGPRWTWNGSVDAPTFQPSINIVYAVLSETARATNAAFWVDHGRYMTREELPCDVRNVCHSFVTDGRIQYLADCTHALAGQTVDLPRFDWDESPTD